MIVFTVPQFLVRPHPDDDGGWLVWNVLEGEAVCGIGGDDGEATSLTFKGAVDWARVLNARAERAARQ